MQYNIVGLEGGESVITVFVNGQLLVAHSSVTNYEKIVAAALAGDESVVDLFDASKTVAEKFENLSERVTVANQRLYFDGDEVNDVLAQHVLRFVDEGVEDYKPLVNFLEKLQTNPQSHSVEQLYTWLDARQFTITTDGNIVGYKGVQNLEDGVYGSINTSGSATVNGELKTGAIPQKVGDVVEMPRSAVAFDPSEACSTGLHVGTWDYAEGFAAGVVLEVHVNPRDVVSVPTDSDGQKMRVCRYTVVGETEVAYTEPVLDYGDEEDDEYDEDYDYDYFPEDRRDEYVTAVREIDDFLDDEVDTYDNLIVIDSSASMHWLLIDKAIETAENYKGKNLIVFANNSGVDFRKPSRGGMGGGNLIPAKVEEWITDPVLGKLEVSDKVILISDHRDPALENDPRFDEVVFLEEAPKYDKNPDLPYGGDPGDEHHDTEVTKPFGESPLPNGPQVTVLPGSRFEDTDPRRAGNVFRVESVDTDFVGSVTGRWEHSGLKRTIATDRLLSRKYRQV